MKNLINNVRKTLTLLLAIMMMTVSCVTTAFAAEDLATDSAAINTPNSVVLILANEAEFEAVKDYLLALANSRIDNGDPPILEPLMPEFAVIELPNGDIAVPGSNVIGGKAPALELFAPDRVTVLSVDGSESDSSQYIVCGMLWFENNEDGEYIVSETAAFGSKIPDVALILADIATATLPDGTTDVPAWCLVAGRGHMEKTDDGRGTFVLDVVQ